MWVRLGLVPVSDDAATLESLDRMTAAIAEQLCARCEVRRYGSPAELVNAYGEGEVDLVWTSPTLALLSKTMSGAVPVVSAVRQGAAHYHGVIFVEKESPIRSVLDLEGTTVAWVAETSAGGYLFPRVTLASFGLDPTSMFYDERFLGSHGAVARDVIDGDAEAGATFAVFEEGDATRRMIRAGFTDVGYRDEARVLIATPPIPADLFMANPALHEQHGAMLAAVLSAVADDLADDAKQVFGVDALVPCKPDQLDELRRQLADARVLGVL